METTLQLRDVTPGNVIEACRLTGRPEQGAYVAPVAVSLAGA